MNIGSNHLALLDDLTTPVVPKLDACALYMTSITSSDVDAVRVRDAQGLLPALQPACEA